MKKSSMFVGLDIHKRAIEITLAVAGRDSEVRSYGGIDGTLDALDKVIRKLVSKGCNLEICCDISRDECLINYDL